MTVSISFTYPPQLIKNKNVRKILNNCGEFARDLWLSRSPYGSGDYANGLRTANSIKIASGKITITNFSKHANYYELGFRSYNIGMAILNGNKNIKMSKDGFKYKLLKIQNKPLANFRKASVGDNLIQSFLKLGLKNSAPPPSYKQPLKLARNLKPGKPGKSNFVVVSEKAIKKDPTKWQMPERPASLLGKNVMNEAKKFIKAAIANAYKKEQKKKKRSKLK